MKKNTLRLAVLAILYASRPATAGEITFDGTLAPAGGRAAGTLPSTNGTYTINQSDGVTRGGNLFHSFGKFTIGTAETAVFSGNAEVRNVITRVTGGQPTTIDGTLRSTIRGAGLWLLNPSGVVFGANAVVDVSGIVRSNTKDQDALVFGDGTEFTIATMPTLLSVAPPEVTRILQTPR